MLSVSGESQSRHAARTAHARCGPKRACARSRWVNDASMLRCDRACGRGDQGAPCLLHCEAGAGIGKARITPGRRSRSRRRARLSSRPRTVITSNSPGEVERPVRAARRGCATWPSLTPAASAEARTAVSVLSAVQAGSARASGERLRGARASAVPGAGGLCRRARAAARRKGSAALSSSSTSVLARSFSPGMAARSFSRSARRRACRRAPRQAAVLGQDRLDAPPRARSSLEAAHVVAVEVFELGEIEARRRAADVVEIERLDHLLGREDLLVAVAPAQADEIVAQRVGQVAHGAVGVDAERAVALRQLGAVRPVDQRHVRHLGHAQPSAS